MTHRAVVNVASGQFVKGQQRLRDGVGDQAKCIFWTNDLPLYSPSHAEKPYSFKAWGLKAAHDLHGATTLIWADACIVPVQPLEPLFDVIERDGYFIMNNGWINAEWTADHAYADLGVTREQNATIKHVVAGAIGLDMTKDIGKAFLAEYLRLAQTDAFIGPTWNSNNPEYAGKRGAGPCGPPTTRGHRHDQTCASVIAWKLGMKLTDPPELFSYKGGETDRTVLVADGNY